MGNLKFTVHRSVTDTFYFRLRTEAGGLLLTSRDYSDLHKCLNEVYSLQVCRDFVLEEEPTGGCLGHGFCLKDPGGIILAISPEYISLVRMLQDMEMITASIREADVEDHFTKVRFFRPAIIQR